MARAHLVERVTYELKLVPSTASRTECSDRRFPSQTAPSRAGFSSKRLVDDLFLSVIAFSPLNETAVARCEASREEKPSLADRVQPAG